MRRWTIGIAVIVSQLLATDPGRAEPVRFAGTVPASFDLDVSDCGQRESWSPGSVTRFADVSLDIVELTAFHHQVTYSLEQPLVHSWRQSWVVPGTVTIASITTTITIDPFTVSLSDYGPLALSPPEVDGQYITTRDTHHSEDGTFYPGERASFDPVVISGSYSIEGPTEVFAGTFNQTLQAGTYRSYWGGERGWDYTYPTPRIGFHRYDITSYPNTVRAVQFNDSSNLSFGMPDGYLGHKPLTVFDGIVDGVPWEVQIRHMGFRGVGSNSDWGTLQAIPEPSSLVLLTMGTPTITIGWWRRRREARRPIRILRLLNKH